jgi:hypothetical protein
MPAQNVPVCHRCDQPAGGTPTVLHIGGLSRTLCQACTARLREWWYQPAVG